MENEQLKSKSQVLEYLEQEGIPVPKTYGKLNLGSLISNSPGNIILRSDHPGEIDGFEGIFDSPILGFNTEKLESYCRKNNLNVRDILSQLELNIQEYLPYTVIGRIYAHPNDESRFFLTAQMFKKGKCYYSRSVCIPLIKSKNRIEGKIPELSDEWGDNKENCIRLKDNLDQLITWYEKVSSLPKFNDGYVWEMEFGAGLGLMDVDFHALQMRKFRLRQKSNFLLDKRIKRNNKRTVVDTVFGLTPEEGIHVNYLNNYDGNYGDQYSKILEETKGENLLINAPHRSDFPIPPDSYKRIKAMAIKSNGILENHTEFRTTKDIPLLLFSNKLHSFLYEVNSNPGSLVPLKIYSDGIKAVIETIKK